MAHAETLGVSRDAAAFLLSITPALDRSSVGWSIIPVYVVKIGDRAL